MKVATKDCKKLVQEFYKTALTSEDNHHYLVQESFNILVENSQGKLVGPPLNEISRTLFKKKSDKTCVRVIEPWTFLADKLLFTFESGKEDLLEDLKLVQVIGFRCQSLYYNISGNEVTIEGVNYPLRIVGEPDFYYQKEAYVPKNNFGIKLGTKQYDMSERDLEIACFSIGASKLTS